MKVSREHEARARARAETEKPLPKRGVRRREKKFGESRSVHGDAVTPTAPAVSQILEEQWRTAAESRSQWRFVPRVRSQQPL